MNQAYSFFPFAILLGIGIGNARSEEAPLLELATPFFSANLMSLSEDGPSRELATAMAELVE